jgi:hypothetical protein
MNGNATTLAEPWRYDEREASMMRQALAAQEQQPVESPHAATEFEEMRLRRQQIEAAVGTLMDFPV